MISVRELVYSLYAAWRLARVDREGVQFFDRTAGGFWRSFFAAAIVLPLFVIEVILIGGPRLEEADVLLLVAALAVYYAIAWLYWPALMSFIVELMGVPERFVAYVVARNWAEVLASVLLFVAIVLSEAYLPDQFAGIVWLTTLGVILAYRGFIASATLGCSFFAAAGLAIGEFVLNRLLAGHFLSLALQPAAQAVPMVGGGQ